MNIALGIVMWLGTPIGLLMYSIYLLLVKTGIIIKIEGMGELALFMRLFFISGIFTIMVLSSIAIIAIITTFMNFLL